jgi:hypothetical protein
LETLVTELSEKLQHKRDTRIWTYKNP